MSSFGVIHLVASVCATSRPEVPAIWDEAFFFFAAGTALRRLEVVALPLAADAEGPIRMFGFVSALRKSSSESVDRSTGTACWQGFGQRVGERVRVAAMHHWLRLRLKLRFGNNGCESGCWGRRGGPLPFLAVLLGRDGRGLGSGEVEALNVDGRRRLDLHLTLKCSHISRGLCILSLQCPVRVSSAPHSVRRHCEEKKNGDARQRRPSRASCSSSAPWAPRRRPSGPRLQQRQPPLPRQLDARACGPSSAVSAPPHRPVGARLRLRSSGAVGRSAGQLQRPGETRRGPRLLVLLGDGLLDRLLLLDFRLGGLSELGCLPASLSLGFGLVGIARHG